MLGYAVHYLDIGALGQRTTASFLSSHFVDFRQVSYAACIQCKAQPYWCLYAGENGNCLNNLTGLHLD